MAASIKPILVRALSAAVLPPPASTEIEETPAATAACACSLLVDFAVMAVVPSVGDLATESLAAVPEFLSGAVVVVVVALPSAHWVGGLAVCPCGPLGWD